MYRPMVGVSPGSMPPDQMRRTSFPTLEPAAEEPAGCPPAASRGVSGMAVAVEVVAAVAAVAAAASLDYSPSFPRVGGSF